MSNSLTPLEILPGIVKDYTDYSMANRWVDGEWVRFRGGIFPEKVGGYIASNSVGAVTGKARSIKIWSQINFADNVAIGTHSHLYLIHKGVLYDITPLRKTTDPAGTDPLATNGNTTITVTDTSHGATTGDYVTITAAEVSAVTKANPAVVTATAHGFSNSDIVKISGIKGMTELNGNTFTVASATANTFELTGIDSSSYDAYISGGYVDEYKDGVSVRGNFTLTVVDVNSYEITIADTASGSTSFGGTQIKLEYNLTTGNENVIGAGGWSASYWSRGGWGSAVSATVNLTVWSLSVWGEDLIANPTGEAVYIWDATNGPTTRAILLSNAPATSLFTRVDADNRHVICYGAHTGSVDDKMLIRWCDQEANTTWAPTATNTAGDYRLPHGGKLITSISTRSNTLVWTDTSLYLQEYTGPPFVFRFRMIADNISLAGQNAVVERDEIVYWMGNYQFWAYDGRVVSLQSPIERYVFDNINRSMISKTHIGVNRAFEEIWFFYCSGQSQEPDKYVIFNYVDPQKQVWSIGSIDRTVWHDSQMFISKPIAVDSNGIYYSHENGVDNDSQAITSYLESGVIEITTQEGGKGGDLMFVDKLIPDARVTGNMKFTMYTRKYPQSSTETSKGPYTITPTTEKVSFRTKGRQARVRIESDEAGASWVMGQPRIRTRKSGKR